MATRFILTGEVQGVSLRWNISREAGALGLNGFVKNMQDGTVEVVVAGKQEDINTLRTFLAKNPGFSKIRSIDEDEVADPLHKGFSIK